MCEDGTPSASHFSMKRHDHLLGGISEGDLKGHSEGVALRTTEKEAEDKGMGREDSEAGDPEFPGSRSPGR